MLKIVLFFCITLFYQTYAMEQENNRENAFEFNEFTFDQGSPLNKYFFSPIHKNDDIITPFQHTIQNAQEDIGEMNQKLDLHDIVLDETDLNKSFFFLADAFPHNEATHFELFKQSPEQHANNVIIEEITNSTKFAEQLALKRKRESSKAKESVQKRTKTFDKAKHTFLCDEIKSNGETCGKKFFAVNRGNLVTSVSRHVGTKHTKDYDEKEIINHCNRTSVRGDTSYTVVCHLEGCSKKIKTNIKKTKTQTICCLVSLLKKHIYATEEHNQPLRDAIREKIKKQSNK